MFGRPKDWVDILNLTREGGDERLARA